MLKTPYYLIDEKKLLKNLEIIRRVRTESGAKSVLALKCFSGWCVFPLMRKYMDGTTSSSVLEARLGYEEFGKETHAFSVGFSREDVRKVSRFADKIIFNSASQLEALHADARGPNIGLRINPGISYSHFDLADPARKHSRLGVTNRKDLRRVIPLISGAMFHFNCENDDVEAFSRALDFIADKYGDFCRELEWVSFGGGLSFTNKRYPVAKFCRKLKAFARRFDVQVYLEPGEAAITGSAELVTTVLDVVRNKVDIAIVDASTEAHLLDHLLYRTSPRLTAPRAGAQKMMIAGRSCLAGDVFGTYKLKKKLMPGDQVRFADAAGYTMVKKNWFNGLPMPGIVVRRLNGKVATVREFGYKDFKRSLS